MGGFVREELRVSFVMAVSLLMTHRLSGRGLFSTRENYARARFNHFPFVITQVREAKPASLDLTEFRVRRRQPAVGYQSLMGC